MVGNYEDFTMDTKTNINGIKYTDALYADEYPPLVAYFLIDTSGVVLDFDAQTAAILNVQGPSFKGVNLLLQAGDKSFVHSLNEALSGKTTYHSGQISLAGREPRKNFATYLKPVYYPSDKLIGVAGFIHYARPGIVSPFEMGRQAGYLNLIAENTHDIISLHSFDGKILFLSPSFEQFTGIPYDKAMQDSAVWPVYPDDKQIVLDAIAGMKDGSYPVNIEYRYIKCDKSIGWAESKFQIISNSGMHDCVAAVTRDITARKAAEDALIRSEIKYRNLMLNLPTGVVLLNLNGKIIEANDAFFKIIGKPSSELGNLLSIKEINQKYNCNVSAEFNLCISEKKPVEGQQELATPGNIKRHIVYSLVPLTDPSGKVSAVMGNIRDHTDLITAEEESRQQVEFLNIIINTLQEPFFVKDEHHKWVMMNDANVEMIGHPRDFLIGKTDYDIFPKEQADVFWKMDDLVLENGANTNEEQITWSTGEIRDAITSKYLYHDKFAGKKFIVGSIHDITHLKKVQDTLKNSEQKYHDLFQNANDLIFTIDLKGNFTDANQRVIDILGMPLTQVLATSVFDVVKNIEIGQFKEILKKLLKDKSVPAYEVEVQSASGSTIVLEVRSRLMYDNNDTPIGITGIGRDITDQLTYNQRLNQYNDELKELNKSKDKMFSIIAHDLKDPFNSLLGFSDILLEDFDSLDRDEMRDYIKIINNTAKHSLNLLENLLTWSRLLTGRLPFTPMKLMLADEVETATTIVSSLAYRKRITVNNRVPSDMAVNADQYMLLSILHNFLMNAIKFTNPGGEINIAAEIESQSCGEDPEVCISITDNGIGMTADEMSKLFKINLLHSTTGTQNEKGTGLGLLLTREMIERHGGTVHVKSEPGRGSTFSFTLPADL